MSRYPYGFPFFITTPVSPQILYDSIYHFEWYLMVKYSGNLIITSNQNKDNSILEVEDRILRNPAPEVLHVAADMILCQCMTV